MENYSEQATQPSFEKLGCLVSGRELQRKGHTAEFSKTRLPEVSATADRIVNEISESADNAETQYSAQCSLIQLNAAQRAA